MTPTATGIAPPTTTPSTTPSTRATPTLPLPRIEVTGPPRRVYSSFVKGYEYLPVVIPARN